jgi:excisionase family DNA binding protein
MVQYYTLQEAAARLQVSPEQLKEMAKKNEVRAFQDRGTLRFRAQEIDELARVRGLSSDPELQLGDVAGPKSGGPKSGPKSGPKTPRSTKHVPQPPVTEPDFILPAPGESEEVPIGQDPAAAGGSKGTPRSTRSPAPRKSPSPSPAKSPRPLPGSDSDVRLVGDGGDLDFQVDSDVKVESPPPSPGPKTPGSKKSSSKVDVGSDSGVRIVPLDDANDSDVKIVPDDAQESQVALGQPKSKTPSDSDIRLEQLPPERDKPREDKHLVTEEIDLDAEALKAAQETQGRKKASKHKPREGAGSSAQLPTVSPFELSEPDLHLETKELPPATKRSSQVDLIPDRDKLSDSSDFELALTKEGSSSPIELGSDEMTPIRLDDSDEQEVGLGELTGRGASGINLEEPIDSGISLEEGGSEEMMDEVQVAGTTPKPAAGKSDSSSEFELSLDDSDLSSPTEGSSSAPEEGSSDSEFELTLDDAAAPDEEGTSSEFELSLDLESSSEVVEGEKQDSSSEFELTLDEGGELSASDEAPAAEGEEKDIFETDFEVPALEDEESGSEAVALDEEGDTDLEGESSEFDLPVDEEGETEAESGSEVVALDEDEAVDELEPAPAARKRRRTAVEPEGEEEVSDFEELEPEEEAEEEEEEAVAAAPPRSWGVVPALFLTPCAFLMFFVCLMTYELVAQMWGYHKGTTATSFIVAPIARTFDDTLPKE